MYVCMHARVSNTAFSRAHTLSPPHPSPCIATSRSKPNTRNKCISCSPLDFAANDPVPTRLDAFSRNVFSALCATTLPVFRAMVVPAEIPVTAPTATDEMLAWAVPTPVPPPVPTPVPTPPVSGTRSSRSDSRGSRGSNSD